MEKSILICENMKSKLEENSTLIPMGNFVMRLCMRLRMANTQERTKREGEPPMTVADTQERTKRERGTAMTVADICLLFAYAGQY